MTTGKDTVTTKSILDMVEGLTKPLTAYEKFWSIRNWVCPLVGTLAGWGSLSNECPWKFGAAVIRASGDYTINDKPLTPEEVVETLLEELQEGLDVWAKPGVGKQALIEIATQLIRLEKESAEKVEREELSHIESNTCE